MRGVTKPDAKCRQIIFADEVIGAIGFVEDPSPKAVVGVVHRALRHAGPTGVIGLPSRSLDAQCAIIVVRVPFTPIPFRVGRLLFALLPPGRWRFGLHERSGVKWLAIAVQGKARTVLAESNQDVRAASGARCRFDLRKRGVIKNFLDDGVGLILENPIRALHLHPASPTRQPMVC